MMTDNRRQCDIVARVWLALLTIVLVIVLVMWHFSTLPEYTPKLTAEWAGEQILVHGDCDGPWLVTHLVAYQANGFWRAVGQLSEPVTIIDSGGRQFSREQIDKIKWLDIGGGIQPPPVPGDTVGVLYVMPTEGTRPRKVMP